VPAYPAGGADDEEIHDQPLMGTHNSTKSDQTARVSVLISGVYPQFLQYMDAPQAPFLRRDAKPFWLFTSGVVVNVALGFILSALILVHYWTHLTH